jgi:hypothetical protein
MKKLFTLFATLAVALSLTMPVYAKFGRKKSDTTGHKDKSKGKAHQHHAKGKGATKGEKEGQEPPATKTEGPK